jgi:hypothetical protein
MIGSTFFRGSINVVVALEKYTRLIQGFWCICLFMYYTQSNLDSTVVPFYIHQTCWNYKIITETNGCFARDRCRTLKEAYSVRFTEAELSYYYCIKTLSTFKGASNFRMDENYIRSVLDRFNPEFVDIHGYNGQVPSGIIMFNRTLSQKCTDSGG